MERGTALLTYEEVRKSPSPKETLLEFMESAYQAGGQDRGLGVLEDLRAGPAD